jgi:2-keto-4-pentenoate hydratase/2-oxohepta-3-ene-1,7-dioic acid hydratase in catechol pathway
MRLVSYRVNERATYGLVREDGGIVDLGARFGQQAPTLRQWLALGLQAKTRELSSAAADHQLKSVTLLPVIPDPAHIWCLAINYNDHINEIKTVGIQREKPAHPAVFMRYPDSLVGANQPILMPSVSNALDWEAELAVIIGKPGRYIKESEAMSHVAGYTCFNDGSIRDWQFHTRQIAPGKNFFGTGALGPWMVTADEIANPHKLAVKSRVNGEVMQDGNTSDMIFDIPAFIAYVSSLLPLQPGDVLATGTPAGVGFARRPQIYMKVGDRCEVEIEGIGTLANPILAE